MAARRASARAPRERSVLAAGRVGHGGVAGETARAERPRSAALVALWQAAERGCKRTQGVKDPRSRRRGRGGKPGCYRRLALGQVI
jgi:hypothetical protein